MAPESLQLRGSTVPAGQIRASSPWLRRESPLLLIVNARATGVSAERTALVAAVLDLRHRVEVAETDAAGHATELARAAADAGYPLVAVLGGDGSMNEAANGLAGTNTALACLPGGRTNVFARALGLPADPVEAAARLLVRERSPDVRRVDLGVMNERYFTFASGVGLSASLNKRVDRRPDLKSLLGPPFLAYSGLSALSNEYLGTPPHFRLSVAGRLLEGITLVVQNADPLTYLGPRAIRVCEGAGLSTGTISLALLRRSLRRELPMVMARLASGNPRRVLGHRQVRGFSRVPDARVTPIDGRPLSVEVDGEYVGEVDTVRYGVAPGRLAVAA
jgi:diacylglycerol kinase family enzyme